MPPSESSRGRLSMSCAECRRLKLKCDREKPCSSCRRRGCASICPQGNLVSKGTRFILANTEQLHQKIDALIARVHQLEEALGKSHSLHSDQTHPLLREEFHHITTPPDSAVPVPDTSIKEEELTDSMGTLTLDDRGSRYFGSTGAFAYLWQDGDGRDGTEVKYKGAASQALLELPPELAYLAHGFPIVLPTENSTSLGPWILENYLPPFTEAWSLFENYWEHYAWHFTPFTRVGFVEQILSPLYHKSPDNGDKPLGHRLGLLFMVFAIGDFMDLTRPLGTSNGLRYYLLSRACLCLDPVYESPTVTALQAMYLMGVYLVMSRGIYQPEHAWVLTGINTKLALTLGLQHDARKFNLPPIEVEAREHVIISILCQEVWQCLSVGRPPSCSFAHFDWTLSKDPGSAGPESVGSLSARHWAANFIRDCVSKVLDAVIGSKATSYSAILQLDAKISQYPGHAEPSNIPENTAEDQNVGTLMQRTFTSVLKNVCLLFLHRRLFAIALRDSPDDPLKSPFAPSVLACYRNAATFLSKIGALHSAVPAFTLRVWFIWPNVFVATLIMGSIVASSPGCSLAASALGELEMACQLWETSSDNVCGPKLLDTVRQLRNKAFAAFAQYQARKDSLGASLKGIEITDEIHTLGAGGPRVISSSTTRQSASPSSVPEQANLSIPSQTTPFTSTSPDYAASAASGHHVQDLDATPYTALSDFSSSSIPTPFDSPGINFTSHFPEFTTDPLPSDFNEVFRTMPMATPTQIAPVDTSILEQLGIGEEWQPVLDDLGL